MLLVFHHAPHHALCCASRPGTSDAAIEAAAAAVVAVAARPAGVKSAPASRWVAAPMLSCAATPHVSSTCRFAKLLPPAAAAVRGKRSGRTMPLGAVSLTATAALFRMRGGTAAKHLVCPASRKKPVEPSHSHRSSAVLSFVPVALQRAAATTQGTD